MRSTKIEQNGVDISLNLDGTGNASIKTGEGFLDHILTSFTRHGAFDLSLNVTEKIEKRDKAEITGLVLGIAFKKALGEKKNIKRFGFAIIPMDESLATVAVDISGRGYLTLTASFTCREIAGFSAEEVERSLYAFAHSAGITLNIKAEGENNHHKIEAIFKALGIALSEAVRKDERRGIPSTKGYL